MAIQPSDILWKLSTTAGTAGDQNAQASPGASLGKYVSTTQISGTPGRNLFDDVSGPENAAATVDYRCVFVHNNHATLTLQATVVWLQAEVAGGASIAIAVDTTAASAKGASAAQALTIANELTAPAGLTFSSPTTLGAGLAVGDLAPGQVRAVWVRRTAANTVAVTGDGVTLRAGGDTLA